MDERRSIVLCQIRAPIQDPVEGSVRRSGRKTGRIFRELCQRRRIELAEDGAMLDHVHSELHRSSVDAREGGFTTRAAPLGGPS